MTDAEKFIEDEMPLIHRAVLPRALKTAYDAVDLTIGETPYLQIPTARMTARGNLLPFAVDFALQRLIDNGQLPCTYEYDFYARPTGKHLKILTANAIITVSQLQDAELQPRRAAFGENYRLENQEMFPFEAAEMERMYRGGDGKKHLVLGHGYQDLNFVQIGVPSPDGQGYLARTRNILLEIHDATPDLVPVEEVSAEEVVTLKKQLQKEIVQHGA